MKIKITRRKFFIIASGTVITGCQFLPKIEESELSTGEEDKYPENTFATIQDALHDQKAELGKEFQCLDYGLNHGAGRLKFQWVKANSGVVDGGSYFDHKFLPLQAKQIFSSTIHIKQFGAKHNTDSSEAFKSLAAFLTSGAIIGLGDTNIELGADTYLISANGRSEYRYGHTVFPLENLNNIRLRGNGATIKVEDHDISKNDGLAFIRARGLKNFTCSGINFDMRFSEKNESSKKYPQCGAIIGEAKPEAGQDQKALNSDWHIHNCSFKLFHPLGQFAQNIKDNAYDGDPNNGFKIYPLSVFGPHKATGFNDKGEKIDDQCNNIKIENCTLKNGHNAYGFWVWAWNNTDLIGNTAESFVGKQTDPDGKINYGMPMFRYMQFNCKNLTVRNNHFTAKPSIERLEKGFEGTGSFANIGTNIINQAKKGTGGQPIGGLTIVENNTIILGNGDSGEHRWDGVKGPALGGHGIYLSIVGDITVRKNKFSASEPDFNSVFCVGISWNSQSNHSDGVGEGSGHANLKIHRNTWDEKCTYINNIGIMNGVINYANNPEKRVLKSLEITNNTSKTLGVHFLQLGVPLGAGKGNLTTGVQKAVISGNNINGKNSGYEPKKDTDGSRAITLRSTNTNDQTTISHNNIQNIYYGITEPDGKKGYLGQLSIKGNIFTNVTKTLSNNS